MCGRSCPPRRRRRFACVDVASGSEVVSQVVDNDGDGTMDELIFQATFAPGESKRFAIEAAAATAKPEKFACTRRT